jgi:hypothetical protein
MRSNAPRGKLPNECVAPERRRALPAADRDLAAAGIDAGDRTCAERGDDRARVVRRFDQHRAEHDERRARVEARARVGARAHRRRRSARARRPPRRSRAAREVLARTERAVEIDDVQTPRARGDERPRALHRIAVVARLARRIAVE